MDNTEPKQHHITQMGQANVNTVASKNSENIYRPVFPPLLTQV